MLEYVGIGRYEQVERTGGWDWVEAEYGVRGLGDQSYSFRMGTWPRC
jgi:hypothetical protein